MSLEEIKKKLEVYGSLGKTLDKIQNQGFYSLFVSSFQSLHSIDKSFKSQEFKKNLKVVISELIDKVWENQEKFNSSPPVSERRQNSNTPKKVLKKSVSSLSNFKQDNKAPANPTFGKDMRHTHREIPITPGPGNYEASYSVSKSKSPNTIFSREKREFDLAHKGSPGPSAYSPSALTQSKH